MSAILRHKGNRILFRVKLIEWRLEKRVRSLHEIVHLDEHAQSGIVLRPEMAQHRSTGNSRNGTIARNEIEELKFRGVKRQNPGSFLADCKNRLRVQDTAANQQRPNAKKRAAVVDHLFSFSADGDSPGVKPESGRSVKRVFNAKSVGK